MKDQGVTPCNKRKASLIKQIETITDERGTVPIQVPVVVDPSVLVG